MNSSPTLKVLLLLLLLPALAACTPVVKDGQPAAVESATLLQPGQSVGQTFTARDRGLNGIEIFLSPDQPVVGEIRLHLRTSVSATTDLAVGTLAASVVNAPRFYQFSFAPQGDSRGHDYYLLLDTQGDAKIHVGTAAGNTYLDGALYQNGNPIDAQMAFRLTYDPVELMIGLALLALTWLQVLVVAGLLFVLPGWALLVLLLPAWSARSWGERLGLSVGVSLALYPLLMLWTNVVGLHLGALYAWLPVVVAIGVLVWRNRAWRPRIAGAWKGIGWDDLALAALTGLVVGVRFWVIRSLNLPMWGDSYQHTMIAQLIVNHGGLFDSWEPYADLQTLTYHFGFHSAVAGFHWLTGWEMPAATLWVGQILNGLAVLALYPLAVRVGGNRWAGVGAVLIVGLLSPMPMYYVNWGRYTQLAGQVVLPVAIYLAWVALEAKERDWRLIGLTWIAFGGLALTHDRILIFAVLFFGAFLLIEIRGGRFVRGLTRTLLLGIGSGVLFLPWFLHTFAGKIIQGLAQQLSTPPEAVPGWTQQYNAIGDLFFYLPILLWVLLLLSITWGLWRREKNVVVIALWWLMILLAANPQWFGLPGEGALSNFAVFIAVYIPLGVLAGSALGWMINEQQVLLAGRARIMVVVLVTALGLWGVGQRLGDMHVTESSLATRPDIRAAAWISEETPLDAEFLVNSFFAYGGLDIVGSDGGWWLPLLARRKTMLPPLTYDFEQGPRADYRQWVNALPEEIQKRGIDDPKVLALLADRGIRYIYIGQQEGKVNYGGPVLEPSQLLVSPYFRSVYHQDRVWIFEIESYDQTK